MNDRKRKINTGLVRVVFSLGNDTWHGFATERIWAACVADGRYQLRNSPFYVYGVSFEDIVFAKPDAHASLVFSGVSIWSGHSTYRLFTKHALKAEEFQQNWRPLELLGCSFEQATEHYLSVDVPPSVDIKRAYASLQAGESVGAWNFEEGHCGHIIE